MLQFTGLLLTLDNCEQLFQVDELGTSALYETNVPFCVEFVVCDNAVSVDNAFSPPRS